MNDQQDHLLACPECGGSLEAFENGSIMGTRCLRCDWAVVTTNRRLPIYDTNQYSVWAYSNNLDRSQLISKLAVVLGISAKDTIAIVDQGLPIATGVHRTEVGRLQTILAVKSISIRTEPPFPNP